MSNRDLYSQMGGKQLTPETRDDWMVAVPGLVAVNADPEHQNRIKCLIPLMDENRICDKWIRRLVVFASPAGYGDSHPPELGSEVAIFGVSAQTHNLFYLPVYNEDHLVHQDLRGAGVRGLAHDQTYRVIVGEDYEIDVAGEMRIEAASLRIDVEGVIEINASRVNINAPGGLWVNGVQMFVP